MGDASWWDTVANSFVQHYYTQFDSTAEARVSLAQFYQAESMLTFNGENYQGPVEIEAKLASLTFRQVRHVTPVMYAQPAPNGGVLVLVAGQLQTDDDPPHNFSQVFHLLPYNDTYFVYNDIFSLVLES